MTSREAPVVVDIPCDVQQEDETGYVWAFLDEARDPSRIVEGAIVVSGDEDDALTRTLTHLALVAQWIERRFPNSIPPRYVSWG